MIQQPNSGEATNLIHLRHLALGALKRWAWATSEDQNLIADILGREDTPANRKLLAKIFQNLGRP